MSAEEGNEPLLPLQFSCHAGEDNDDDKMDPQEAQFYGAEAEEASDWTNIQPQKIGDVKVVMQAFDTELLDKAEKEWKHILNKCLGKARTRGYDSLTLESIMAVFLMDFIEFMAQTLNGNAVKRLQGDTSKKIDVITPRDCALFLETEMFKN